MKEFFLRYKEQLLNRSQNLRDMFARIALVSGIVLAVSDGIAGFFIRTVPRAFLPVLIIDAVLAAAFTIMYIRVCRGHRRGLVLLFALTNLVLFPIMFFLTGGITGSGGTWFLIGIVSVFLIFTGKKVAVMAALACAADITCYVLSYNENSLVAPMASKMAATYDSCQAVLLAGLALGMFFYVCIWLCEEQRKVMVRRGEELQLASRAKDAFFASMSHEIRTPINTIIGLNEMTLREPGLSDEVAENSANIHNASKMLLTTINDILDLAKIESGKMEIVPVQYETGAMFSDLVNLIWIRARNKNLEFNLDIDKSLPSMLYGDEVRIKQIVANMLTNAVKYTEKGSITLSAKAERTGANEVNLQISVSDTGKGIKKENLKNLFTTFTRVDEQENRNIEGTGLGLSISKQLIEMMGGRIGVDSVYRAGTTFSISVKQRIVDDKPLGAVEFMTRKKRELAQYHQSFEAPDANILVVDDNEMNLMVAKKLLRGTKVRVDTAASGQECLALTKKKPYHAIFMDHMMPDMDGEQTLKAIRAQEDGRNSETPVIALTANVMSGADQIYEKMGFDGYLAKPINGALFEVTLLKYLPAELVEYTASPDEKTDADAVNIISSKRKKKIAVTADCLCDLPEDVLKNLGIKTMYFYVKTDDGRFCDTSELSARNLIKYLEDKNKKAYSSPASVSEYEEFFASALKDAEKVIHLTAGKHSSGGFNTASAAAESFDNVTVVDTGQISSGMGICVMKAAEMAKDGYTEEEITEKLDELKNTVSTSFVLDSAESLHRNGRISGFVNKLCNALHIHPVLHLSQGSIKLRGFITGSTKNAFKKYVRRQLKNRRKIDPDILFIGYAGLSMKELKKIQADIEKIMRFDNVTIQSVSATVAANSGNGTLGLQFVRKKK